MFRLFRGRGSFALCFMFVVTTSISVEATPIASYYAIKDETARARFLSDIVTTVYDNLMKGLLSRETTKKQPKIEAEVARDSKRADLVRVLLFKTDYTGALAVQIASAKARNPQEHLENVIADFIKAEVKKLETGKSSLPAKP